MISSFKGKQTRKAKRNQPWKGGNPATTFQTLSAHSLPLCACYHTGSGRNAMPWAGASQWGQHSTAKWTWIPLGREEPRSCVLQPAVVFDLHTLPGLNARRKQGVDPGRLWEKGAVWRPVWGHQEKSSVENNGKQTGSNQKKRKKCSLLKNLKLFNTLVSNPYLLLLLCGINDIVGETARKPAGHGIKLQPQILAHGWNVKWSLWEAWGSCI